MKTKVILHLLITFCLLFTPTYASATGQASERIIINGERLNMLTLPIEQEKAESDRSGSALSHYGVLSTPGHRKQVACMYIKTAYMYHKTASFKCIRIHYIKLLPVL